MPRTTDAAVKAIIDVEDGFDLTPFIETANALVTEVCAPVTTYDATRLELIERWLAAHCYAVYDPRPTNEHAKSVGVTYESRVDLGFDVTKYGQMAMRLDTNGGLAALNSAAKKGGKRKGTVTWLGTGTGGTSEASTV